MRVDYRSALITGAGSGIGAAFAAILPASTDLLLSARSAEQLERVAAPLATGLRRVDTIAADLATPYGCAALIERALERGVDLFICNAGTAVAGDFPEVPISRQRETLAVNVVATVELLHALIPDMIARARWAQCRAGVIVVSSMGAFGPAPGLAVKSQ